MLSLNVYRLKKSWGKLQKFKEAEAEEEVDKDDVDGDDDTTRKTIFSKTTTAIRTATTATKGRKINRQNT